MKGWNSLEYALRCAKNEKEKRKVHFAIRKYIEKTSTLELREIIKAAEDEFIREQAEMEFWWREFSKKPKDLLKLIRTSDNKEKIEKAIKKLGNMRCRDARNTIVGFLEDIDLRDSAALALRKMPAQQIFEPLVRAIKKHPDGEECLLYALQVLDCSEAAELLVELFISKPNAIAVRDDIFVCFAEKAVRCIPKQVKDACCSKVLRAIEESKDQTNTKELRQFYEVLCQTEEY